MANAIEQLKTGLTVGYAALGFRGGVTGSVRQQAHDGDTLQLRPIGNLGVRFLGVDAPEISFTLPRNRRFIGLSNPLWEVFMSDPFDRTLPPFRPALNPGLLAYLKERTGPGAALNHYQHASVAEDALEEEVSKDIATLGQTEETFQFFLSFAHEVMDRYGRLLAFINRLQSSANKPKPRPLTYNERLLKGGRITPYFIWPNINPFRRQDTPTKAVIPPGKASEIASKEKTLSNARKWVREARKKKIGIFDAQNPLRLLPFEIRFLSQRRPPDRWVIDLSKGSDVLIQPQNYYTVPNMEDRLFIPAEFVPLFVEAGWKRQA
jgi:endonuclease YncB( thermonuclease family)